MPLSTPRLVTYTLLLQSEEDASTENVLPHAISLAFSGHCTPVILQYESERALLPFRLLFRHDATSQDYYLMPCLI